MLQQHQKVTVVRCDRKLDLILITAALHFLLLKEGELVWSDDILNKQIKGQEMRTW